MSHDLKTPITRLRLRAELLEQPELREKFVRDLSEMEQMVNSTLGFMRGLDDREPLRQIDVRALVEALQADAEELGHPVRIVGDALSPFSGKSEGLKRALQNLLDNAVRYGRDAEIVIEDQTDALNIVVRDRGPGVLRSSSSACSNRSTVWKRRATPAPVAQGWASQSRATSRSRWAGSLRCATATSGGLEARLSLPRTKKVPPGRAQPSSEQWTVPPVEREA
jgi:K+-sensing histidine kinase KdpD